MPLAALDPGSLILYAATVEFYLFAATFLIAVCILSLKASIFILASVLEHSFPEWRTLFGRHNEEGSG
jgi:hypothetical protein